MEQTYTDMTQVDRLQKKKQQEMWVSGVKVW